MEFVEVITSYYLMMGEMLLAQQEPEPRSRRRKRRLSAQEIVEQRDKLSAANTIPQEIFFSDPESFQNYTRMTMKQFENLLQMVAPHLQKSSIRKPIPERDRLLITLRFVTTGDPYSTLSQEFRIGKATIHKIIKETTVVIWESLKSDFIKSPTITEMQETASLIYSKTGLPNCIGAIDCKHCIVHIPPKRHALWIVLLAVCDADYMFTYVDIDAFGSESQGDILRKAEFGQKLLNSTLNLPEDSFLPNSAVKFPHFIVGDKTFPLKKHLLRPYEGKNLTEDKKLFNTHLSSVRRCIENAFRILVNKFRIYHKPICVSAENAQSIVKCTIALHNYIRRTNDYLANSLLSSESLETGNWNSVKGFHSTSDQPAAESLFLRDTLKDYLGGQSNSLGNY